MKIKRLDLKAYGHFTDQVLEFAGASPGLHIIYGPNEAGKSTALRALQGLLYGIPLRTADNFLHDYGKLLIGGRLENADGRELTFWRRKKNIGDLLDAEHNIIDQSALAEFLHGIEEPLFTALFGIDHETLVSGGRDILEQKGDIGQALFSAGAGLAALHGLIAGMEKESEGLFKAGGSKPELNQAIKTYQELKKEIRELALSSAAWKEQQAAFDAASAELAEVEQRKNSRSAELERLKRLQRAIPHLVRRRALQERLVELGDFGHLPHDFPDRLKQTLQAGRQIENSLQDSRSRQQSLRAQKDAVKVPQEILDQAETIDALHQKLGVQRQAEQDRPEIQTQLIQCRTEAATLLNQVAPGLDLNQTEQIKSLLDRRQTILTLANRFAGLDHALTQSAARVETLTGDLTRIEEQLAGLSDVGDLQGLGGAVAAAQRVGDIDGGLKSLGRDSDLLLSRMNSQLKQLGLWTGTPQGLLDLALPSTVTIDTFAEQMRQAAQEQRQNQQEQKTAQEEIGRVRRDIAALEKAGAVATEDDLARARQRRDRGWRLVRRAWLEGELPEQEIAAYAADQDLPGAFEQGMQAADEVADHLRSAADRVHQYASLLADADQLAEQQRRLLDEAGGLAERRAQLELEWTDLWRDCNLTPRSPGEMRLWLEQCQEIRRNLRDARQKEADIQPLLEKRQQLHAALTAELTQVGRSQNFASPELSPLLAQAEQVLAELQRLREKHRTLRNDQQRAQKELTGATMALQEARQAMTAWTEQWVSALEGFGLPADARADEAANALETLRTCLDQSARSAGYAERLRDIDRHAGEFAEAVGALVRAVAPELESLAPDQAVVKLLARVKAAEKTKSVLEKLEQDLASVDEEIRRAGVARDSVQAELTALQEMAGTADDETLLEVEGRFRDHLQAARELTAVEETLLGIAEGIGLDLLEEQRQASDPNELPGLIEVLEREIQTELTPRIKHLAEKRGEARNELQKMDGSGAAAAAEDAAQAALAKVRRLADRYLRVRLGSRLLKKEIERYRQENQDPILHLASRYFSELTLTAYPGLRSDLDDHGNPILVGVCPDGSTRSVEAMSSGTRDQLYLALRLATLEWRLEKHEPMPFIADDILVNFDDSRSGATLKALAALAQKNQVILFTHHRRIVETVEALDLAGDVVIHPLAGGGDGG